MSVCPSIFGAKLMMIDFTKMHGAGNDFVVIDAVRKAVSLSAKQIQTIANRHTGIGCDQVKALKKERGIGIAAPQIGVSQQIFIVAPNQKITPPYTHSVCSDDRTSKGCC